MNKIFKIKKETILWIIAFSLLVFIIGYTIYAISFLAGEIDVVLKSEVSEDQTVIRFDFDNLNKLFSGKFATSTFQ